MLQQHLLQPYTHLIFHVALTFSLSILLIFLKVPIFFLQGLFTYIHPDHLPQQNGVKAAIRRPSSSDSASDPLSSKSDVKRRNHKSKEKFEFDENNAQIFRLKLDEAHLQSRIYFSDYWYSFIYPFIAFSSFLLYQFLNLIHKDETLTSGSVVPVVLGFGCLCKLFISLARLSFEKSASKTSDKQLSVLFGALGFLFVSLICSGVAQSVLDFNFGSIDGKGRFFIAVLMGCLSGFLYMPAAKNARAFWLGTDQLRSSMSMISCGWFARMILYANFLVVLFTTLLWIKPSSDILVKKSVNYSIGDPDKLAGNVGFTPSDFTKFRLWCLFLSGLVQLIALRPNLQMYLNEALLSWYQRLHASKVPDLDFSRAKVFLHNHYLCLVVMQFFAPPILVLVFLGISQVDGNSFKSSQWLCSLLPCTAFVKEVYLFMAWWVILIWTVFTSGTLLLYRRGIFFVS